MSADRLWFYAKWLWLAILAMLITGAFHSAILVLAAFAAIVLAAMSMTTEALTGNHLWRWLMYGGRHDRG